LARVAFKVLQNSPSTLNIEHAKLVAIDLQTIPSETAALSIGSPGAEQAEAPPDTTGSNDSPAPAPVDAPPAAGDSGFPWWIVAAVIMVLGILALGGYIVMDGLNKSTSTSTAPATPPQPKTDIQPGYPTGTRPSAFKNHVPTD
jgi:hypothetical protein